MTASLNPIPSALPTPLTQFIKGMGKLQIDGLAGSVSGLMSYYVSAWALLPSTIIYAISILTAATSGALFRRMIKFSQKSFNAINECTANSCQLRRATITPKNNLIDQLVKFMRDTGAGSYAGLLSLLTSFLFVTPEATPGKALIIIITASLGEAGLKRGQGAINAYSATHEPARAQASHFSSGGNDTHSTPLQSFAKTFLKWIADFISGALTSLGIVAFASFFSQANLYTQACLGILTGATTAATLRKSISKLPTQLDADPSVNSILNEMTKFSRDAGIGVSVGLLALISFHKQLKTPDALAFWLVTISSSFTASTAKRGLAALDWVSQKFSHRGYSSMA